MIYRRRSQEIEATQWHRNGDHPLDDVMRPFEDTGKTPIRPREGAVVRYFRHPVVSEDHVCCACNRPMKEHGFIDQKIPTSVCPGSFVITESEGYRVLSAEKFEVLYERLQS